MTRTTTIACDRCGQEDLAMYAVTVTPETDECMQPKWDRWDLCGLCRSLLTEWWHEPAVERDRRYRRGEQ